ncbi:MAG: metallophosphoesterase [Euryarchaeota archaeon]|nr:metallophosphoesterase [Euryarchaeota archaeon]MDE1835835.1 metallophosphoesterase [Euryarchaeota archaeon]MDE1880514.1 metallophosphoesterase [Euryarchaeota archaeon]MDE2045809.1 metallophosphoesterase [Thermoplasmata archaeon]
MRDRVLALFEEHHLLVEESALALILASPMPLDAARGVIASPAPPSLIVTPDTVNLYLSRVAQRGNGGNGGNHGNASLLPSALESGGLMLERPATLSEAPPSAPVPSLASQEPRASLAPSVVPPRPFHLIREGFVAPPEARAPLEGVTGLLVSRFRQLSKVLRRRADLTAIHSAAEVLRSPGEAAVIGMVRDIRETPRQKLLILTLEDESGQVRVLIPKEHPAARETYLPDEVLGVRLFVPKEAGKLPIARAVLRPEVPVARATARAPRASKALFLSDLHIGSKGFLTDSWNELLGFVRGEGTHGAVAEGLEHVVIAGDLVDGIGIYPHQENDLAIADVVEQYAELARRVKELPSHLNIVAVPGNHDAVCPAEPQPALPPELSRDLPPNVHLVANPSVFALEGVVIEAYHGRSFDDLIPQLPKMSYEQPIPVMKRMLSMRHLAPSYGLKTPLASLPRDGLVVDPVPDIFVTGHTHTFGAEWWRGILLLNASTWQGETDYQRMRNIRPVPARATVVDLAQGDVSVVDFHRSRPEEGPLVPKPSGASS